MFCVQCEQTMRTPNGNGCAYAQGMCGKTAATSDLQDVLIYMLQGVSAWALAAREVGIVDEAIDTFVPKAFFSTLTNVNFDNDRLQAYLSDAKAARDQLKTALEGRSVNVPSGGPAHFEPATSLEGILAQADIAAPNRGKDEVGEDIVGLRLLALYGLKGAAAYMEHACALGRTDAEIAAEFHRIMAYLGEDPTDIGALLDTAMQIGQLNYRVMALLDEASTSTFGNPVPTQVNWRPTAGKAILVSGHDLIDLKTILELTEGTGINVYTHGEMLPAHGYPELNKYQHLVGHYGTAWQNQQREFAEFPGAIVMTSNCLINPEVQGYADRIFTRSIVGWPGVTHLEGRDFTAVVDKALALKGFEHTEIPREILVGFGRETLLGAAPAVIDKVKAGKISHFFLIGGCDGDKAERTYYTEMAEATPQDSMILTLGCGKFKVNQLDLGEVDGLPRLLDIGQCNDAYSALQLALHLADAFECGVNDLPLTLVLSWFEQKAIVILLTLLSLGVKNIYTGPTAPAFLTDNLLKVLTEQFQLRMTTTVEQDLKEILAA